MKCSLSFLLYISLQSIIIGSWRYFSQDIKVPSWRHCNFISTLPSWRSHSRKMKVPSWRYRSQCVITMTMFMVLSSWNTGNHCESSPGSFDECRLSAGWPPILRPNQPIWAVRLPIGCYHPQTPSPFIIITQLVSWYSFYRPTEDGRLSRSRHCSKGAQPVLKTVYRSDCHDKHDRPQPAVRFEPGSFRTAVGCPATKPPRPAHELDWPGNTF